MERKSLIDQNMKRKDVRKKAFDKQLAIQDNKIYENIKKLEDHEQKDSDKDLIKKALQKHGVFFNMSELEQHELIKKFFYCQVGQDEKVFEQNSEASCFFIIEQGQVEVIINNQVKKQLQVGDSFGELALLYSAPRSATIKAFQPCTFWALDRTTFKNTIEEITQTYFLENRKFVEQVKIMENFTEDQKSNICKSLITLKFNKGENIVNEGEAGSSFFIIKKGEVQVLKGSKVVRVLHTSDSFGEGVLMDDNHLRACTCSALEETICLSLGKEDLISILGDQVQNMILKNNLKWTVEKAKHLSKLVPMQKEQLYGLFRKKHYKAGDVILQKGKAVCKRILICQQSNLIRSQDKEVIAKKGQVFHDSFFTKAYRDKAFDEDVQVESDGLVFELYLEDLVKAIGGELEEVLKRNQKHSHEIKMLKMSKPRQTTVTNIQLNHLVKIKKLGQGQFGKVYLVKSNVTGELYALKCISKNQIISQSLEKYLKQEKIVCEMVNFPFCMQFIATFKDDHHIFFLLEYIKGMELFDAIREIGLLGTYDSQFYISQMILSIEYLHNLKIIYRDIKPENIMVDEKGYLKLIDMGTAKILAVNYGVSRTFTIIGTPHYMAPEIINGKGYSLFIDLWSIGICLFEFMCGYVPFGDDADDPYQIYQEIISSKLTYPHYMNDKKAIKLIKQLLSNLPEIRLGQSFASLKRHSWFENFDWDKLLDKQLKPALVPNSSKLMSNVEIDKNYKQQILISEELYKNWEEEIIKSNDPTWDEVF